jgi:hypothetical protein
MAPSAAGIRNASRIELATSWTMNAPMSCPIGMQTPRIPATVPRCPGGIWSASNATVLARAALKAICATHQAISIDAMESAVATNASARQPPRMPATIHGRRMPARHVVRSLK